MNLFHCISLCFNLLSINYTNKHSIESKCIMRKEEHDEKEEYALL
jgi:hypothetical protein